MRPKTAPTANEFEDLKKKCKKYHEYLRRLLVAIYIAEHGTSIGIYDIGVICEQKVEDLIRMNEHDDDVDAILQVRGALGLPRPTVKVLLLITSLIVSIIASYYTMIIDNK